MIPAEGDIVLVTWRDAFFQYDPDDADRADYLVRTVGFVAKVTTKFLGVAAEELPDDDGWRALTWIPLSTFEGAPVVLEPAEP